MSRGGSASAAKGTRYEGELVTTLQDLGFGVLRAPSSGSATDEDLPDILAGRSYRPIGGLRLEREARAPRIGDRYSAAWAIEHKSGNDSTLYVKEDEVVALKGFAAAFGATPLLGARFTTQSSPTAHYLVKPENAHVTDGGNYGLPLSDIQDRASVIFHPGDDPELEEGRA